MPARPAHPPRSSHARGGSIASRSLRGVGARPRAWAWLLALSVMLQGSVVAMTRAAEPAHFHIGAARSLNVGSAADLARDPMLDLVRVVQNHHGSAPHQHTLVERHEHDAGTADVAYIDDDAAGADAAKSSGGKRAASTLDTPPVTTPVATTVPLRGAVEWAPCCAFESHIGERLERPPR